MSRAVLVVLRVLVVPLALGFAISLAAAGVYWGLEALLVNYADHDRGLWEGAALVTVINAGNMIVKRVLKRANAKEGDRGSEGG